MYTRSFPTGLHRPMMRLVEKGNFLRITLATFQYLVCTDADRCLETGIRRMIGEKTIIFLLIVSISSLRRDFASLYNLSFEARRLLINSGHTYILFSFFSAHNTYEIIEP